LASSARVGQQGTITRVWAKRGSRPRAPRDRRYEWAYLFGAVCPERGTGAAIIMPEVNVEAMNEHLAEISRRVSVGAIALLVLDGAGWHSSPRLDVPDNIVLLPLPPYAPGLNPVENVWEFLRANFLSHRVIQLISFGVQPSMKTSRRGVRSGCLSPHSLGQPSPRRRRRGLRIRRARRAR